MAATVSILCPTGHLGFTPLEKASFLAGAELRPDFVIADSGSCDIGPYPLGADGQSSPPAWQRHDLEVMLLAARRLGVPMIIGSASDTGTDRGVRQYADLMHELAAEHGLAPFRMATIFSEQTQDSMQARLSAGTRIAGLDGREDADAQVIARTDRIVAVMGAEPIAAALKDAAEVVIAGRSRPMSKDYGQVSDVIRTTTSAVLARTKTPVEGVDEIEGRRLHRVEGVVEPLQRAAESPVGDGQDLAFTGHDWTAFRLARCTILRRDSPNAWTDRGNLMD